MARFNEILVGRYNRAMQKLLSMKGAASLLTLSDELFATYNTFSGVENRYIEAWERFGNAAAAAGGAAQIAGIQYRNPTGSNMLAVFEKLTVGSLSADQPQLQIQPKATDLTTVNPMTTNRVDARSRPTASLINSQTTNFGAIAGNILEIAFLAANTNYDYIVDENQELPLLPGDALIVTSKIVNVTLTLSAVWRERFLEDSERA